MSAVAEPKIQPFHFHVTESKTAAKKTYFTPTKYFQTLPLDGSNVSPSYYNDRTGEAQ